MEVKKPTFILIMLLFLISGLWAQENEIDNIKKELYKIEDFSKSGKSNFLLRGYAHAGLNADKDYFNFDGGSFNPILVFKQSDRLLFESELELEMDGSDLSIGLEYANISYLLSKTLTIRAGKLLLPFGIFVPNLHPAWINKFATKPLGLGHGGILPSSDFGFALEGGSYIGNVKVNYAAYVINGPRLNDGLDEPDEAGMLHHGIYPDNNNNKAFGGRLGIFPFPSSVLEVGFSGMHGKVGNKDSQYADVASILLGADLSFVKKISALKSMVDIKSQYSQVKTDDANYVDTETGAYSFNNFSSTFFGQLSIKPAFLENVFLRKLELAARFSTMKTPKESMWATNQNQLELGLDYWIDWRTVIKATYTIASTNDEAFKDTLPNNVFLLHWAIGF